MVSMPGAPHFLPPRAVSAAPSHLSGDPVAERDDDWGPVEFGLHVAAIVAVAVSTESVSDGR